MSKSFIFNNSWTKEKLIELVKKRSFKRTDKPTFKLSAGGMSCFYFNMKPVIYSPTGLNLISNLYLDKIMNLPKLPEAIGGLTMGADPISISVSIKTHTRSFIKLISSFSIRKELKQHGTKSQVEGDIKIGDSVVIVDDVVTTGTSTIKAIRAANEFGLNILAVIVLLDRGENNGLENIKKEGYPTDSILNINDFIEKK